MSHLSSRHVFPLCVAAFMCMQMYTLCAYVCVHTVASGQSQCHSSGVSHWPGLYQVGWAGWPVSPRDPVVFVSVALEV